MSKNKNFDVYKWRRDQINEETTSPITKKLKDVTWDDVAGLAVPSSDFISMTSMDNRDMFSDEWRQDTLNNWKQKLLRRFPNAMEFNIVIDRNAPMWFNKVKITNPEYLKAEEEYTKAVQADYERNRGRYQGD
jgi:hypothetical protein